MAFTYTGDPLGSVRDATRLLIGDTDETCPLLTDQEVDYYLTTNGNAPLPAAAEACDAIAARLMRQVDQSLGKLSVSASQRAANFAARAKQLTRKLGMQRARFVSVGGGPTDGLQRYRHPALVNPQLEPGLDMTPSDYLEWEILGGPR